MLDQEREASEGMADAVGLFARLRQLRQLLQAALAAARARPVPLAAGFRAMLSGYALFGSGRTNLTPVNLACGVCLRSCCRSSCTRCGSCV